MPTKQIDHNAKTETNKRKFFKAIVISTCLTLALTLLVSCGGSDSKSSNDNDKGGEKAEAVALSLHDSPTGSMGIDPATVSAKNGDEVVLKVTNDGTMVHNLSVDGGEKTADLQPFSEAELNVGKVTSDVTLYCTIPGHREAGMEMKITVEG